MLRNIQRPEIYFDLIGLADRGLVTVGRESESFIRLDSPAVPYLLSRKHGAIHFHDDGIVLLSDLNSTNGTYVAREHGQLRKLSPESPWKLRANDQISFGGPEKILVEGDWVPNPFVFRFYPIDTEAVDECLEGVSQGEPDLTEYLEEQRGEPNLSSHPTAPIDTSLQPRDVHEQRSRDQLSIGADTNNDDVGPSGRLAITSTAGDCDGVLRPVSCTPNGKENVRSSPRHAACCGGKAPAPQTPTGKKMKEILHSHLTCPICQEWLLAAHALPCGHMFCGLCLATWLQHRRSCPTCRKRVSGVPVRCFQVDGTINDVLAVGEMSPSTKLDRKRKQESWEEIQESIVLDWVQTLKNRRQRAMDEAIAHHAQFQAGPRHDAHSGPVPAARPFPASFSEPSGMEVLAPVGLPIGREPSVLMQVADAEA